MSFDSQERSLDSGCPVRLYQFARGVLRWLYNSSDRDITRGTQVFRTVRGGILDEGIVQSGQASVDLFKINAPADLEVAQLYRSVPPSSEVALTVFDRHHGDNEDVVVWTGSIQSVRWPQLDSCQLICQPLSARMSMQGLRQGWERACHRALYDLGCTVNRDLYQVTTEIQDLTGASISSGTFASYPEGYFTAGFVEWSVGSGEYDRRAIERHSGSTLTLLGGTAGLAAGRTIRVYPGCDQTIQTCNDRFDNVLNFGGIWHLAGRSPFDGNPVF
ncbi:phage BR0599 family protein [Stutzerimonas nitrititolerans]|uniref:phage BR0599 family protein n=1 Tax=Stutzerimonas nitrititolerans TaxID=2482751 RepID=UPI0028987274|nr:phage BR0599 family protein [Stutzerimonas nitrititolerans]